MLNKERRLEERERETEKTRGGNEERGKCVPRLVVHTAVLDSVSTWVLRLRPRGGHIAAPGASAHARSRITPRAAGARGRRGRGARSIRARLDLVRGEPRTARVATHHERA